jgi:hypothetical protein
MPEKTALSKDNLRAPNFVDAGGAGLLQEAS